ncbi:MAG: hypothetical protein AUK49_06535 [Betaproteobacteria bacterium CG2_30_68_42]|nr:MAG: hypothetical protein AUK49_06535 [Betaproteobacteria bacterium CG2_30_68_42]PIX75837.1 MAG: hypothetical protein COZ38_03450 [Rhodocyclales bacterium CG_4_10_14_3_um_filter_68_10]PJA57199.1 MAG: hypothetical protein CO164_09080 [Rhodocyclales bacterium CG_4_9_14_3_um_filter_68_10]
MPVEPERTPVAGVAALIALCAVYLLAGAIGHDPWKPDDALHFGIVYSMLESGRPWMPQFMGETLPGTPPLYYWVAAASARLFGWVLPVHDAARIAAVAFGALLLSGIGACARALDGAGSGALGVLVAIGCIGLVAPIHDLQPAIALLAACAFTLYGLIRLPAQPLAGALIAAVSIALGTLAQGAQAIVQLAPLAAVPAFTSAEGRRPAALVAAALVPIAGAGLAAAWSIALAAADPALFAAWRTAFTDEFAHLEFSPRRLGAILSLLGWFGWPAAPLALWTLWRRRRSAGDAAIAAPLAAAAWLLLVAASIDVPRTESALPLLVPLVLLAVPGATTLRRGAANALDWFAVMTFTLFAGLAWLGWVAMSFGVPARLALRAVKLEPGFVMTNAPFWVIAAGLMSATWLWQIAAGPRHPARATLRWALGMTTIWVLFMTLWLPWIEYGKSYRPLAASLARALPPAGGRLCGYNLGAAQRASLDYFAGIRTRAVASPAQPGCALLLMQAAGRNADPSPGTGWRKLWEGRRPGDRRELFRLFVWERP